MSSAMIDKENRKDKGESRDLRFGFMTSYEAGIHAGWRRGRADRRSHAWEVFPRGLRRGGSGDHIVSVPGTPRTCHREQIEEAHQPPQRPHERGRGKGRNPPWVKGGGKNTSSEPGAIPNETISARRNRISFRKRDSFSLVRAIRPRRGCQKPSRKDEPPTPPARIELLRSCARDGGHEGFSAPSVWWRRISPESNRSPHRDKTHKRDSRRHKVRQEVNLARFSSASE